MTVANDILRVLEQGRPLDINELTEATRQKKRTIESTTWKLRQDGKIARSADGKYSLVEVEPVNENGNGDEPPEGQTEEETPPEQTGPVPWDTPGPQSRAARTAPSDVPGPQHRGAPMRQPISGDRDHFRHVLQDCGVNRALDTITDTFFSGNIEDLEYLLKVLEDARAYVTPQQKRLIARYWAEYTYSTPLPAELEARLSRDPERQGKAGSQPTSEIGWQVVKDGAGDWVPKPGGDLESYEKALRWAATMNATKTVEPEEAEGDEEGETTTTRGRRRGGGSSLVNTLLKTVIERAFPNGKGDSASEERIRKLEEQLAEERETRLQDRFDRLEAQLAANAGGDPVGELVRQKDQLVALGIIPQAQSVVTDNSPTVQILKDSSDKLDKNMNRFVGILERAMLRGHDEIIPENRTTEAEQESRAANLLHALDQNDRSRGLRKSLWGR